MQRPIARPKQISSGALSGRHNGQMIASHWPLFSLKLTTKRLELRLPSLDDLAALADVAADGVHDPAVQPFGVPWTDATPMERARATLQYHWRKWGSWQPDDWSLDFVTVVDGVVAGTQGLDAQNFAILRQVHTGSWLGRRFHGNGLGTEMRAAALHLAFTGLAARSAISGAFDNNAASLGVARSLGYDDDGVEWRLNRGQRGVIRRLRIDRETWFAHPRPDVEIEGLEACRSEFGIGGGRA